MRHVPQVVDHRRVLVGGRHEGIAERVQRRHPGRNRGGERLSEERAEWLVLPGLDVPGRPVVDQHHPEHVLGEVVDGHPSTQRTGYAHHEADLGLDVEAYRWAGDRAIGGGPLPGRPDHRRAGDHHRAGPPVVADRQVLPVGQQRRLAGAEDLPHVRRVVLGGVEVDVVGHLDRKQQLHLGEGTSSGSTAARCAGSVSSSVIRCRTAVHCGRPSAMKSLRVGRHSAPAASTSSAASAAARSNTHDPIRTPIRD